MSVPAPRVKKDDLRDIGTELGAKVEWNGGKWVATFPHVESKYVNPGQPVRLRGSRRELFDDLLSIKRHRERRGLTIKVPAYGKPARRK